MRDKSRLHFIILLFLCGQCIGQSVDSYVANINAQALSDSARLSAFIDLRRDLLYDGQEDSIGMVSYFVANYSYWTGNFEDVEFYGREAIRSFRKVGYWGYRRHASYYYIINALRALSGYDEGLSYRDSIMTLPRGTTRQFNTYISCVGELAKLHILKGDQESAKNELLAVYLDESFDDTSLENKRFIILSLARSLLELGSNEQLNQARQILNVLELASGSHLNESLSLFDFSEIFLTRERIAIAMKDYSQAILFADEMIEKLSADDRYQQSAALIKHERNASLALLKLGKFEKSYKRLTKIEPLVKEGKKFDNIFKALFYQNIGLASAYANYFDVSQHYFDIAFSLMDFDIDGSLNSDLASLSNKVELADLIFDYMQFLKMSKKCLQRSAGAECHYILDVLDTLTSNVFQSVLFDASVVNLKEEYSRYYRLAVDLAFSMKDLPSFIKYSELNKGILLSKNRKQSSSQSSLLVDNLKASLDKLKSQEIELDYLFSQIHSDSLRLKIVKNRKSQLDVKSKLRAETILKSLQHISIETSKRSKDYDILYFQFGQDSVYGLHIASNGIDLNILGSINEIGNIATQYLGHLKNGERDKENSNRLFEILVAPFEIEKGNIKIVAEDFLYNLPFESFISDTVKYRTLLHDYNVSYSASLTLDEEWSGNSSDIVTNLNVVSPQYDTAAIVDFMTSLTKGSVDYNFTYLTYSKEEVRQLDQHFKVNILQHEAIKKSDFLSALSLSDIFHFTGHAILNPHEYRFSFIALGDKGDDIDNVITMSEINEAETSAEMVFLNACNTGSGKILRGEGVFNLARAFFRAGAKSVINALWEIDDQSSSQITITFYKYLKKGHTKSSALRQAKLDYLNSDIPEYKKHPYYWAGLVLVGNDAPLCFGHWYDEVHWTLFALFPILFVGGVVWRRSKLA